MNNFFRDFQLLKKLNWTMAAAMLILAVVGVMYIYSSSFSEESQTAGSLYKKQIVWIMAGAVCFAAFAALDYQELGKWAWWSYFLGLLLLVVVLFIGKKVYGARRWLDLFGARVQPSEFAKLAVLLVLARVLSRPAGELSSLKSVGFLLAIVAVPAVLLIKEPDLGTALIFAPTLFVMMFAAGVPTRTMLSLFGAGVLGIASVIGVLFLPEKLGMDEAKQDKIMSVFGLREYHKNRMSVFLNSNADPLGAGWNKMQSEIAVGSGGTWGKGFRKGTQNILRFLPRTVSSTDFIYSVLAEEAGFFGSVMALLLFAVLVFAGSLAALRARDKFGRVLCMGVVTIIFCHVFINIAMTIGLMPIIGVPLPLLSYGGSFMITTMSALGIAQSVHIRSQSGMEDFS